jgi:hypothetical protein
VTDPALAPADATALVVHTITNAALTARPATQLRPSWRAGMGVARQTVHEWLVVATIPIGRDEGQIAVNPATNTIYMTHLFADTVPVQRIKAVLACRCGKPPGTRG